jgi:hypothetical protein
LIVQNDDAFGVANRERAQKNCVDHAENSSVGANAEGRVRTATTAKPGFLRIMRRPKRTSWIIVLNHCFIPIVVPEETKANIDSKLDIQQVTVTRYHVCKVHRKVHREGATPTPDSAFWRSTVFKWTVHTENAIEISDIQEERNRVPVLTKRPECNVTLHRQLATGSIINSPESRHEKLLCKMECAAASSRSTL